MSGTDHLRYRVGAYKACASCDEYFHELPPFRKIGSPLLIMSTVRLSLSICLNFWAPPQTTAMHLRQSK